jgi:hypothetical protein
MKELRETILQALIAKYQAAIAEHKANITVMLENGVGVAEHPGVIETIDKELELLSEAEDKLLNVNNHFAKPVPPKVV